jgi:hypothetical protein
MSTSFDQAITTNIIPDVAIADAPLPVHVPQATPSSNPDNPFLPLFLFVPFIFLLAIAALLISKLIKFGLKQWRINQQTSRTNPYSPRSTMT